MKARSAHAGFLPGGFSVIELAITLAVLSLLVLLAMPSYRVWIANSRVRSTSESIQNGLRLARNQAITLAQPVRFELPADGSAGWILCVPNGGGICDGLSARCEGSTRSGCLLQRYVDTSTRGVTLATAPADSSSLTTPLTGVNVRGVTFDVFGRADTGAAALGRVDVSSAIEGTRRLVDVIRANGAVRQCDADLRSGTDTPEGCG